MGGERGLLPLERRQHVVSRGQPRSQGVRLVGELRGAGLQVGHAGHGGCRAGLALNPGTPAEVVRELVDEVDLVLCMTVNPGWGGQRFLPGSIDKLGRLRGLLREGTALEVDGGVDADTAGPCARAGATVFVAGSAVFGAPDPQAALRAIADATRD